MNIKIMRIGVIASAIALASAPYLAHAEILTRQLEVGSRGTDVSAVQTYLATDPTLYPQGLVTGYFGFLTKSAVANFQSRNSIEAVGRIGPITLPVLNAAMAGNINTGTDVSISPVTNVSISVGKTTATIGWYTTDMTRGKVYYSTSPIRFNESFYGEPVVTSGANVATDGIVRNSQSITLTNLVPNTTYYYLVVALDQANNASITLPASFHTTQ